MEPPLLVLPANPLVVPPVTPLPSTAAGAIPSGVNQVACLVFLLLNWLLEAPRSMEELQALYQQHPWCARTPSDDTIRLYINTLKALGCQVQRPTKHTKKRYVLQAHPFTFPLFEAQEEAVIELLRPLETFELPEAMATLKFLNNLLQYAGVSPETTERFRNRLQLPHLQDTLSMVAQLERPETGACPLFKVTYQAHAKQSKRQWVLWPLAVVAEAGRFYLMALEVAGADTASPTIPQERLLRLDRLLALAPLPAVAGQQAALQQAKQQFEATVPLLELKLRSCVRHNFRGFGLPGERWHTVEEPFEGANPGQGVEQEAPAAWQHSHYQVQTPFRFLLIQRVLASGVEILEASPSLFKEELCQWLTGMLGRYTASSFTPADRPETPSPTLAKRGLSQHATPVTPPPHPIGPPPRALTLYNKSRRCPVVKPEDYLSPAPTVVASGMSSAFRVLLVLKGLVAHRQLNLQQFNQLLATHPAPGSSTLPPASPSLTKADEEGPSGFSGASLSAFRKYIKTLRFVGCDITNMAQEGDKTPLYGLKNPPFPWYSAANSPSFLMVLQLLVLTCPLWLNGMLLALIACLPHRAQRKVLKVSTHHVAAHGLPKVLSGHLPAPQQRVLAQWQQAVQAHHRYRLQANAQPNLQANAQPNLQPSSNLPQGGPVCQLFISEAGVALCQQFNQRLGIGLPLSSGWLSLSPLAYEQDDEGCIWLKGKDLQRARLYRMPLQAVAQFQYLPAEEFPTTEPPALSATSLPPSPHHPRTGGEAPLSSSSSLHHAKACTVHIRLYGRMVHRYQLRAGEEVLGGQMHFAEPFLDVLCYDVQPMALLQRLSRYGALAEVIAPQSLREQQKALLSQQLQQLLHGGAP